MSWRYVVVVKIVQGPGSVLMSHLDYLSPQRENIIELMRLNESFIAFLKQVPIEFRMN